MVYSKPAVYTKNAGKQGIEMSIDWKDYLANQGAVFSSDGTITEFKLTNTDLTKPTISLLDSQTFAEISGPDSLRFLQGQLSCNMEKLAQGHHTTGVACNAKGRMYASFRIANTKDSYLLKMHRGLTKSFSDNLSKYAVFYKTQIDSPKPTAFCLGLSGKNTEANLKTLVQQLPDNDEIISVDQHGLLLKVPHIQNCYELWLPETALVYWWEKLAKNFVPTTESYWTKLNIAAAIPQVRPEYIEKYIPQHLNFPSLGSVSFRKGCYTGQEIIARMQNLGQQKSRTYPICCEGIEKLSPGSKLENQHGKLIGEILESASITGDGYCDALAVIKIDSVESHDVYLSGQRDCPVKVSTLPYLIDTRKELLN